MPKFNVTFKKEVNLVVEANSLEEAEASAEKTAYEDGDWIDSFSDYDDWEVGYCHGIVNQQTQVDVVVNKKGLLERAD